VYAGQTSPVAQNGSSGTYPASNCASAARDGERRSRQEIPHRSWLVGARDQDLVFVRITRLFPHSLAVRIAGGKRSLKRGMRGESVMRRLAFKEIAIAEIAGLGVVKDFCDGDGPHGASLRAPLRVNRPRLQSTCYIYSDYLDLDRRIRLRDGIAGEQ